MPPRSARPPIPMFPNCTGAPIHKQQLMTCPQYQGGNANQNTATGYWNASTHLLAVALACTVTLPCSKTNPITTCRELHDCIPSTLG